MTREETWKLIIVLKSAYPKTYEKFGEMEFENLCTAFHMCLEDYTYEQAALGLKAFMITDTKGFPPVAGQIIEQIQKMNPAAQTMGAMEAWALVYKAICNSTYNAESEFEKLPELCKKVIGNPSNLREMAGMDMDTVKSVEQSHFIRQYNSYAERERELAKLPQSIKERIGVNETASMLPMYDEGKGE